MALNGQKPLYAPMVLWLASWEYRDNIRMSIELNITLGEPHRHVLYDNHRFVVLDAGRGFGKTQLILARMYRHLQTTHTDGYGKPLPHKIWYLAPTYKQGKMLFWGRLKEFFWPFIKTKNESDMTLILLNGAEIRIVGSEQYDNLRGPYLTKAIFDEFAFHKPNYWMRVIRPMLGRTAPMGEADFMSTPDGHNEFYELFNLGDDSTEQEWQSFHFTSLEGGFVPAGEVENARKNMTLEDWRQEYFGEFIASAGRVYYAFDRKLHCKPCRFVPGLDIHMFWDFNETPSCHMGLAHVHKGRVYVFDEVAIGNTEACMAEFLSRYNKHMMEDPDTHRLPEIFVYGDATGTRATSGITDYMVVQHCLAEAGFKPPDLRVMGYNPLVKDRTNSVNVKLKNAAGDIGMIVNLENCPKLVRDFEQVKRRPTGDIDKITDRSVSHISDALGYFVFSLWPVESPSTRILRAKPRMQYHNGGYWTGEGVA